MSKSIKKELIKHLEKELDIFYEPEHGAFFDGGIGDYGAHCFFDRELDVIVDFIKKEKTKSVQSKKSSRRE